ncbi:MAG: hypothetical protein ACRDQA_12490 [Nocardioidaceae bacterium]
MDARFGVGWALRIMLAVIFIPHSIGKLEYVETFASKFHLSDTVSILTGVAELLAVAGMIVGGLALSNNGWRRFAWPLTALATLAIWIVQIGAIVVARWPSWLEYADPPGMEYNVTILVIAACVLWLTPWTGQRAVRTGGS